MPASVRIEPGTTNTRAEHANHYATKARVIITIISKYPKKWPNYKQQLQIGCFTSEKKLTYSTVELSKKKSGGKNPRQNMGLNNSYLSNDDSQNPKLMQKYQEKLP